MKGHIKIYLDYFGYAYDSTGVQEPILSELSGQPSADIHHIDPRGMGGSKTKDTITNLIALTREEHDLAEAGYYTKDYLSNIHKKNIDSLEKNY